MIRNMVPQWYSSSRNGSAVANDLILCSMVISSIVSSSIRLYHYLQLCEFIRNVSLSKQIFQQDSILVIFYQTIFSRSFLVDPALNYLSSPGSEGTPPWYHPQGVVLSIPNFPSKYSIDLPTVLQNFTICKFYILQSLLNNS